MRPLRVLVVEDDVALRTFYQLTLLEHGHTVNAVGNGADALKAVTLDIDVVITDLSMPLMTGEQLIATLRATPEYRDLPVLVVTAHPGELRPELRNGKTAVLRKPFQLDDFIKWVDLTAKLARADN